MNRRVPGVVLVLGCSLVGAFFGAACSSASTPSAPSPAGPEARFAVGATPYLALFNGLGHAPSCETVFEASSVLTLVASPAAPPSPASSLRGPSRALRRDSVLTFEECARRGGDRRDVHDPRRPRRLRGGPRTPRLARVAASDSEGRRGRRPEPGERPRIRDVDARRGLRGEPAARPADGGEAVRLGVAHAPRRGKCALRVDYFGAHTDVTVTVR